MVSRPQPGRAIVMTAGGDAPVECVDRCAIRRDKGDVNSGFYLVAQPDPEERLTISPIAGKRFTIGVKALDAERPQRRVEYLARSKSLTPMVT